MALSLACCGIENSDCLDFAPEVNTGITVKLLGRACVCIRPSSCLVAGCTLEKSRDFRPLRGRVVSLMAANCTEVVTCLATSKQGGKYGLQIIRSRSIARHPVDQLAEVVSTPSQGVHVFE